MRPTLPLALLVSLTVGLVACGTKSGAPPPPAGTAAPSSPAGALQPVDSVVGLMAGQIAPSSAFLWEAVGTVTGPKGTEDKQPRTDAEWAAVRRQALILIEASNLLLVQGRHVAWPGEHRANPPGSGDLTPEASEAAIGKSWPAWSAFATTLRSTALDTLKTIDAKDANALMESGGAIDEACEACHKAFWYPDAPAPGAAK
jgi:hypothetical protein